MTRANKALAVLVVAAMGLWGCAQGPANGPASAERIKALESKCTKLEEDYKAVATARDQLRKRITALEEERNQLLAAVKERDELRQQMTARTAERDAVLAQFDQFRKGIRSLLGQAEAGLVTPASTPTVMATSACTN